MNRKEYAISDRTCFLYQDEAAKYLLIQPIDEHDLEVLDQEFKAIKELSDKPFSLVAFMIKDWNQELTPWTAPPVFGKVPFGSGAEKTLEFITCQLLPEVQDKIPHLILGGYSLAGLFALWAGYQTDKFEGIAAASPSVYGTLSGLILRQRINRLQSPSISALATRRRKQRILLWRRSAMPSASSMNY